MPHKSRPSSTHTRTLTFSIVSRSAVTLQAVPALLNGFCSQTPQDVRQPTMGYFRDVTWEQRTRTLFFALWWNLKVTLFMGRNGTTFLPDATDVVERAPAGACLGKTSLGWQHYHSFLLRYRTKSAGDISLLEFRAASLAGPRAQCELRNVGQCHAI